MVCRKTNRRVSFRRPSISYATLLVVFVKGVGVGTIKIVTSYLPKKYLRGASILEFLRQMI